MGNTEITRGYKTTVEVLRYMGMRVIRSSPRVWYVSRGNGDLLKANPKLTSIMEKKYQDKYGYIGEEY